MHAGLRALSLELAKYCTQAEVLFNDGSHDIPKDAINTRNIALAVERALSLAFLG